MAEDSITVDMGPLNDMKIQSSATFTNNSGELLPPVFPGTR